MPGYLTGYKTHHELHECTNDTNKEYLIKSVFLRYIFVYLWLFFIRVIRTFVQFVMSLIPCQVLIDYTPNV
jgi:hypothetical protein